MLYAGHWRLWRKTRVRVAISPHSHTTLPTVAQAIPHHCSCLAWRCIGAANEPAFLNEAAHKALTWMQYQSPDDFVMVSQLPTSDWRDEQWVLGYGLYVNALVYAYLRLYGEHESARHCSAA